jgi:hypothetical protein
MATYYVATTGNDTTGDGSSGNPWATPGKGAASATSAGDIVYVKIERDPDDVADGYAGEVGVMQQVGVITST